MSPINSLTSSAGALLSGLLHSILTTGKYQAQVYLVPLNHTCLPDICMGYNLVFSRLCPNSTFAIKPSLHILCKVSYLSLSPTLVSLFFALFMLLLSLPNILHNLTMYFILCFLSLGKIHESRDFGLFCSLQ